MNREAHDPAGAGHDEQLVTKADSYVHPARTPSTNQEPTAVEPGGQRPKPVFLTSTAAFRVYIGQVDALVTQVAFEKVSRGEALQAFDYALGNLEAHLRRAFERRLDTVETPAEAPAATEPP